MSRDAFNNTILEYPEYKILDNLVHDPHATIEDAVQKMVDLAMAAQEIHKDDHHGAGYIDYKVSLSLIEHFQRLEPTKHRRLIEFLLLYQKQTLIDPSTGEPLTTDQRVLFNDLPSLGYVELETWDEVGGDYKDPTDLSLHPKQRQRWVNLNAFEAQYTQISEIRYPATYVEQITFHPVPKPLRAIWTINMAMENTKCGPKKLADTAAMEAACMWFIYAAERLWDHVQLCHRFYPPFGNGAGSSNPRYKKRKWNGFERDRWDVWVEGLEGAREKAKDERMKGLIEEALASVKRAMQNP